MTYDPETAAFAGMVTLFVIYVLLGTVARIVMGPIGDADEPLSATRAIAVLAWAVVGAFLLAAIFLVVVAHLGYAVLGLF